VLHCVAASMLILQLVLFLSPTRRVFAFSVVALGAAMILATPFVWNTDFAPIVSPFLSPYFNWKQTSIFPLFPFAAFLFTGVVAGHFYLEAKEKERESEFVKGLLVVALSVVALGINFDWLGWTLYPEHDYWKASPNWFLVRVGIVAFICSAFYYVRSLPKVVEKNLIVLGQASLLIYPIHLLIVYGSSVNYGLMQRVGQTLAAHQAVLVGMIVLISMLLLTYLWNYLRKNFHISARLVQAGLASSLLYTFLTRPW
jgi:acyltransferase